MNMKKVEQMDDYTAKMKTKFARLAALNDPVSESVHVENMVSLLSYLPEYAAITALINMKNAMRLIGTTPR